MDILIVEDNPYNMMVIHEMLKKLGYEERYIDKATTGAEAIQKAITKQYDVILMDLLLPTVDGLAAGTQILSYYRNRCPKQLKFTIEKYESLLPTIVALTAMVTADTQNKCKAAGFRGFLSKPLDKEELETMLAIVAKRRAQSRKNLSSGHVS
jgi:CheY-like chemotaxis protein